MMYWLVRIQNSNINNININVNVNINIINNNNILNYAVTIHSVLGNNLSFSFKSVFMGVVFALINTKQVEDHIIITGSLEDRCFSQISKLQWF